jgi:hypothetical protein
MECLSLKKLPTGEHWTYEIKLDGFRVEAVRTEDSVRLYSKQGKLMTNQFIQVAQELEHLTWLKSAVRPLGDDAFELVFSREAFQCFQVVRPGCEINMRPTLQYGTQKLRLLGQAPFQLSPGVRDWRLYSKRSRTRCAARRHLQRQRPTLAGAVRGGFSPALRRQVHTS